MLQNDDFDQLKTRADRIGVALKVVAAEAGLHPSTPYRAMTSGNYTRSTYVKLLRALEARERLLRDHLLALHPLGEGRAAA